MCIQLASLGPGTCFKITPHFSNSRKTRLVSPGENLETNSRISSVEYKGKCQRRKKEHSIDITTKINAWWGLNTDYELYQ